MAVDLWHFFHLTEHVKYDMIYVVFDMFCFSYTEVYIMGGYRQ